MSGLGDLFAEAEGRASREAGDARLGGDELGAVQTTVRRAHSRRAALRTGLVAVAVVVLGGGLFYGVTHLGQQGAADAPGLSASPSETASATPTPSPTPSDTVPAMPGFAAAVALDPHLPEANIITPEVWASVEPGWSLISYREAWFDGDRDETGPQVVYLVSPAGARYELTELSGDTVSVLAWAAGSTSAAVSVQPDGDPPFAGVLDLVTGEVTPVDGYAPYMGSLAFLDPDGAPVWRGNDATSAYVAIAPDGTQEAYTIPAAEGAEDIASAATGKDVCFVAAPYDDASVLVECYDGEGDPNVVVRVWPGTGKTAEIFSVERDGEWGMWPTRAGDFVVARRGQASATDCPQTYGSARGDVTAPVPGVDAGLAPGANLFDPLGEAGNVFVWSLSSGCSGDAAPIVVVSSDLDAGSYAVLMPYPTDRPKGETPIRSVTGVAVSH